MLQMLGAFLSFFLGVMWSPWLFLLTVLFVIGWVVEMLGLLRGLMR